MTGSIYYKTKYNKYKTKYNRLYSKRSLGINLADDKGSDENKMIQKLSKEYARYLVVENLKTLDRNPKYLIILERVLMNMINLNFKNLDKKDEIFIDFDLDKNIRNELSDIKQLSHNELNLLLEKMKSIIKQFISINNYPEPIKYGNNEYTYFCDKFEKTVNKKRIDTLRQIVRPTHKKYADLLILICLLRYECIISKFQQWNMPFSWYKYLYDNHDVRYEGFASPFNCQLIMIDKNTKYSSLFYDTDKYFNSLGNIFAIDFRDLKTKYKINNGVFVPPYINEIVKKTIYYLLDQINRTHKMEYILLCPKKPETYEFIKPYNDIKQSSYLIFSKVLKKDQWYFENNTLTNKKIKFFYGSELNIFVLSNKKHKTNFYKMLTYLSDDFEVDNEIIKYKKILDKEYSRYLVVMKISKLYSSYEFRNILERFLNSMANIKSANRIDSVFLKLDINDKIYQKMINEINDKKIKNSVGIVHEIKKNVDSFLENEKYLTEYEYGRKLSKDDNIFYCGSYTVRLDRVRVMAFINRAGLYDKSVYYVILILIMLLRYECVMAGGQNWNIPFNWYKFLYNEYNVILEGFSSPLNSQLILLSNKTYFCSLFYDTDKIFGSLGNLFELDIIKLANKHNNKLSTTLHPPYIPHILEQMIDLIDNWFKLAAKNNIKLRIFAGFPNWTNYPLLDKMINHKYLKFKKLLKTDEFYFENTMVETVQKIFPILKRWTFILANFDKDNSESSYELSLEHIKFQFK